MLIVSQSRSSCLETAAVRARVTALIIVVGLLAQAFAMVRHGTSLLSTAFAAPQSTSEPALQALLDDLQAVICHPGGLPAGLDGAPTGGDAPGKAQSPCPICNGLATAYGPPPHVGGVAPIAFGASVIEFAAFDQRVVKHRQIRPQSRGPPAQA